MDCGEVMDVATTAELRTQRLLDLEGKQPLALDASRVVHIDIAALQVLSFSRCKLPAVSIGC